MAVWWRVTEVGRYFRGNLEYVRGYLEGYLTENRINLALSVVCM